MSATDPISDLLARIRNAHLAKKDRLDMPASRLKGEICRILKEQGFIKDVRHVEGQGAGTLRVFLRYDAQGAPAISHLRRVSKPGRRVYRDADELPAIRSGLGIGIVSTSQGLLSDAQARERRVGGELLCEVW
jgi:small subunit ribosomal protein S8